MQQIQDISTSFSQPLTDQQRCALTELIRRKQEEKIRYFTPNPGAQVQFLDLIREKREVAYFAGNKSGKTYTAAQAVCNFALSPVAHKYGLKPYFDRPTHGWVGSVSSKVQREAAQAEVEKFLPLKEIKKIHKLQNAAYDFIELKCGSTIGFKAYESGRESWQGPVKDWIWFDEEPPHDIMKEGRARLTAPGAKCLFTLTPLLGLTKVYDDFIEHPTGNRGYVIGSTYENKQYLDPQYLAEQEALPEDEKQSRLYGLFMRLGGLVFPEFRRDWHVVPHFTPKSKDFIFLGGMDFGADHPTAFVIVAVDLDGNLYVFDEYKETNVGFDEHAEGWFEISKGFPVMKIFRDPSAKQAGIEFKRRKIYTYSGNRDRAVGISLIRTMLLAKKIFISDRCLKLIYEFEHHQKKHSTRPDQRDADVVKTGDDLLDALRYLMAAFFKTKKRDPIKHSEGNPLRPVKKGGMNW